MSKVGSDNAVQSAQSFTNLNNARRGHGIDLQMIQNSLTQLRRAVNTIEIFTDGEDCIELFLEGIGDEKACVIISGYFG